MNRNIKGQRYGRKPQGTCQHCLVQLWGDMELKVHLDGQCIPSRGEAEAAILALLKSNLDAGLIDEIVYRKSIAVLGQ